MADFCRYCTIENFGLQYADKNEMMDEGLEDDEFVPDLCEGCGYGYFDRLGQRVSSPQPEGMSWSAKEARWVKSTARV